MKRFIKGFFMAWGMFLAIPCPVRKWDENARPMMLAAFPLIGIIVGGLWALTAWLVKLIGLPRPLAALVTAALPWLVTGFIHLDGFADVCDAVLSRRPLEERQRILKDPHTGAFGAIGLILVILAQFAVFLSVEPSAILPFLVCLGLVPAAVRSAAGAAMLLFPAMKSSSYSGMEPGGGRGALLALPLAMLAASLVIPAAVFGVKGLAPAAACAAYLIAALSAKKNLGGMNGDISGFALVLGELAGAALLIII